jgi:uncharacterized RDD family membrane protein YckC
MRTVELFTTQNVSIAYELATLRERVFAALLDLLAYLIVGIVFLSVSVMAAVGASTYLGYLLFVTYVLFAALFSLIGETMLEGQTLGKRLLAIRVVKLTGEIPEFKDYVARWSVRFLEIWLTFGSLAALLATSSAKGQRLGDLLAGTTVVRLRPSQTFSLRDILTIRDSSNYEPRFPEVVRFSEKDLLLIKTVLGRHAQFPNPAHRKALETLSDQVARQLGLPASPADRIGFLRTVINDYIVLTR